MLGRIDERHGDLPRHSAEQKPNNSKLSSENLAKVGRSKTARGKIANSGIGEARARVAGQIGQKDPGASCRQEKPGRPGRKLQTEGARPGQTQAAGKCEVARTERRKNGEGPP